VTTFHCSSKRIIVYRYCALLILCRMLASRMTFVFCTTYMSTTVVSESEFSFLETFIRIYGHYELNLGVQCNKLITWNKYLYISTHYWIRVQTVYGTVALLPLLLNSKFSKSQVPYLIPNPTSDCKNHLLLFCRTGPVLGNCCLEPTEPSQP